MRRFGLIILCCGIINSAVSAQNIINGDMAAKAIVPPKGETVRIWLEEIDTLPERSSSLEGKKIDIGIRSYLTDEEVDVFCLLPNIYSATFVGFYGDGRFASDEAITKLTRLENLRQLRFICGRSKLTDEAAKMLHSFKKLEALTLVGNFSLEGYASIGKLKQLRELDLMLTLSTVSDKELAFLEKLPELRKLTLTSTSHATVDTGLVLSQFTDDALSRLQNLNDLEELVICCDSISGKGLSHLLHLKSLRRLEIHRSPSCFIEDSLRPRYREFDEIRGNHEPLDDAGMEVLKSLRQLKSLDLCNTGITDVHSLQQALPDCQIKTNWK